MLLKEIDVVLLLKEQSMPMFLRVDNVLEWLQTI